MGAFKLWPLMVIGMMPLCLGGILREISLLNIMLVLTVSDVSQKQAFPLYE